MRPRASDRRTRAAGPFHPTTPTPPHVGGWTRGPREWAQEKAGPRGRGHVDPWRPPWYLWRDRRPTAGSKHVLRPGAFAPQPVIAQHQGGHRFDHGHGPRDHTRV